MDDERARELLLAARVPTVVDMVLHLSAPVKVSHTNTHSATLFLSFSTPSLSFLCTGSSSAGNLSDDSTRGSPE